VARFPDRESVTIYWYAVPNANKARGGWMPVYDRDGWQRGNTYGEGYDLQTALKMAKVAAREEAAGLSGGVTVAQKPGGWGIGTKFSRGASWQGSYANWTVRVGELAAKRGVPITFGAGTLAAWRAGVSPEAYVPVRSR